MSNGASNRPVTLRDIAETAGVNPSTVSRAMRDDPRLRAETRRHIQDLARSLQYRPNPFVTAYASHVRNHRAVPERASIAVLNTYADYASAAGWASRYEAGIRERATDHGFGMDTFHLGQHDGGGEEIGKIIEARGIRGLIIMPIRGQTVLTGMDFEHLAVATIDLSLRNPMVHRASPDYFQGIQMALDTLRSQRYRRIGFCTYRGEVRRIGSRWLGGFMAWQLDGNPEERVQPFISSHGDVPSDDPDAVWRSMRDSFEQWLQREKPDAIVSNDLFYKEWLLELGVRIPGEVAFASLGTTPGKTVDSGIDQHIDLVGSAAMDLVAGQLYRNEYGIPAMPKTVLVPATWVDGETTL